MTTAATAIGRLLDDLYAGRPVVGKTEILRTAEGARVGEDALEVIRDLPDGEYTREGVDVRVEDAIRDRERSRMAGMDAHSEPGFNPPNVRRHPSHQEPRGY